MSILLAIELPKDFYTLASTLTLSGSVGAVFLVSNGIQAAFNFNPKWLGLVIALIIALAGVYFSHGAGSDYFVGIINGFLIYGTATGATQVLGRPNTPRGGVPRAVSPNLSAPPKRKFLTAWW